MIIKRGKVRYKFPPHSSIFQATIGDRRRCEVVYMLQEVHPLDLKKSMEPPGKPTRFTIYTGTNEIEFYPPPDKPYKVTVRYAPPIKEW